MENIKSINADLGDAVLMSNDPNLFTDKIQIYVSGREYKTLYTKNFINRKRWQAPNPNEVKSIIPGSVTDITVKVGDKVKKGAKLMIYEAMKMKNVIAAPFDAVVERINVNIGDKLPKGEILMILKPIGK